MYFRNLLNKVKLPFRKDKELYRRLYAILGFYPKDISLYKQALLHKSLSVKGKNGNWQNNERLEFLGDAILDAIVGDIVYRHFEGKREGFLTNTRSKIVQRETLGKLAVEMGLDRLIRSNGQHNAHKSYMAGNAFEALVGAIYLDYGYMQCMRFMEKRILAKIINIDKVAYQEVNFKSKLLEWSQKNRIKLEYKDREQRSEKEGQSIFTSMVVIEGLDCGQGKGYSKKESQQMASKETLYMLKKQKGFEESVFEAKSRRTAMEEQPEALLPDIPDEAFERKTTQTPKQEQPKQKQEQPKQKQEQPKQKQEQPKAKQEQPKPKQEQPKPKQEQPKAKQEQPKARQEQPKAQEPQKEEPVKKEQKRRQPRPNKETPEKTGKPDNPGKPENLGNPEVPETPGNPEAPETPGNPEVPEKPEKPGNPGNPEQTDTPDKAEAAEKPKRPRRPRRKPASKPQQPEPKEPQEAPESEASKETPKQEPLKEAPKQEEPEL